MAEQHVLREGKQRRQRSYAARARSSDLKCCATTLKEPQRMEFRFVAML
jgi:hypothetical protein